MTKICLWAGLFFSLQSTLKSQNSDFDLKLEYDLFMFQKKEMVLLNFFIQNSSDDTLLYWIQNWQLDVPVMIGKKKRLIELSSINNLLFFYSNKDTIPSYTYSEVKKIDSPPSCMQYKKIPSLETFIISFSITDQKVVSFFKNTPKEMIRLAYFFTYFRKPRSYVGQESAKDQDFFYSQKVLSLNFNNSSTTDNRLQYNFKKLNHTPCDPFESILRLDQINSNWLFSF